MSIDWRLIGYIIMLINTMFLPEQFTKLVILRIPSYYLVGWYQDHTIDLFRNLYYLIKGYMFVSQVIMILDYTFKGINKTRNEYINLHMSEIFVLTLIKLALIYILKNADFQWLSETYFIPAYQYQQLVGHNTPFYFTL